MMGGITAITVAPTDYGVLGTAKRVVTRIEPDESQTWVQEPTSLFLISTMSATNLRKRNPLKSAKQLIDDETDNHVLDEQGGLPLSRPSRLLDRKTNCLNHRAGARYTRTQS